MPEWRVIERDLRDQLGEGALWCARDNALYWTDILAPALNRLSLEDGSIRRWAMPEPLGWIAERRQGGFVAGLQSGFAWLSLDPVRIVPFGDPEPDLPHNRMNDGKADEAGNIWCGTMDVDAEGSRGSLYRLAPEGHWTRVDSGYIVTNGPAFSNCGRWFYHTDTGRGIVYRFERTEDGLANRRPFIRFERGEGLPDGMTVDAEGGLWVAHWGGGRVSRFDPEGRVERAVHLPAKQVTNLAFGGADLDRLFVTSAATGVPPSKYDGALFEIHAGVRGMAPGIYTG